MLLGSRQNATQPTLSLNVMGVFIQGCREERGQGQRHVFLVRAEDIRCCGRKTGHDVAADDGLEYLVGRNHLEDVGHLEEGGGADGQGDRDNAFTGNADMVVVACLGGS